MTFGKEYDTDVGVTQFDHPTLTSASDISHGNSLGCPHFPIAKLAVLAILESNGPQRRPRRAG
jgi:hypothetical protein